MDAVHEQDTDTLSNLEERITRAVQAISSLRNENSELHERLKTAQAELDSTRSARDQAQARSAELQTENGTLEQRVKELSDELGGLRGERKQVKARIEKLLGQLDLLSAS